MILLTIAVQVWNNVTDAVIRAAFSTEMGALTGI
jgi:hypothetical protein